MRDIAVIDAVGEGRRRIAVLAVMRHSDGLCAVGSVRRQLCLPPICP